MPAPVVTCQVVTKPEIDATVGQWSVDGYESAAKTDAFSVVEVFDISV